MAHAGVGSSLRVAPRAQVGNTARRRRSPGHHRRSRRRRHCCRCTRPGAGAPTNRFPALVAAPDPATARSPTTPCAQDCLSDRSTRSFTSSLSINSTNRLQRAASIRSRASITSLERARIQSGSPDVSGTRAVARAASPSRELPPTPTRWRQLHGRGCCVRPACGPGLRWHQGSVPR